MSRPVTTKSNILYVTDPSTEGRWAMKGIILTRGRSVGRPKTCNLRHSSSKRYSDVVVKDQGISDSVIVVIKLKANEDKVTYQRIKLLETDEKVEAKGRTC